MDGKKIVQIVGAIVIVLALTALYFLKGESGQSSQSTYQPASSSEDDSSLKGLKIN